MQGVKKLKFSKSALINSWPLCEFGLFHSFCIIGLSSLTSAISCSILSSEQNHQDYKFTDEFHLTTFRVKFLMNQYFLWYSTSLIINMINVGNFPYQKEDFNSAFDIVNWHKPFLLLFTFKLIIDRYQEISLVDVRYLWITETMGSWYYPLLV